MNNLLCCNQLVTICCMLPITLKHCNIPADWFATLATLFHILDIHCDSPNQLLPFGSFSASIVECYIGCFTTWFENKYSYRKLFVFLTVKLLKIQWILHLRVLNTSEDCKTLMFYYQYFVTGYQEYLKLRNTEVQNKALNSFHGKVSMGCVQHG